VRLPIQRLEPYDGPMTSNTETGTKGSVQSKEQNSSAQPIMNAGTTNEAETHQTPTVNETTGCDLERYRTKLTEFIADLEDIVRLSAISIRGLNHVGKHPAILEILFDPPHLADHRSSEEVEKKTRSFNGPKIMPPLWRDMKRMDTLLYTVMA